MNSFAEIREKLNGSSKPGGLESQPERRCRSAPPQTTGSWVAREKPARYDQGRSRLAEAIKPEPITEEPDGLIPTQLDGYDSDEEDRRNGVPITYSQGQFCRYQAATKYEIEVEFKRLKLYGDELSATLGEWKLGYMELRRHFSETLSPNMTVAQWENFLVLENAYFTLKDELFDVQDKMEHLNAQMYLFLDYTCSDDGFWFHDDNNNAVWCVEGAAEKFATNGEYPTLQSNGVDYDALDWPY
ncbi:hypothetical protein F4823DRAFT_117802 [Ustulina deusta]|nr:hypothetical protein F4823DRAFT_117802 [Ustulina deusta]